MTREKFYIYMHQYVCGIHALIFVLGSWICDHCVAERNGKRKRPTSNVPAALLEHNDYITFKSPVGKKGSQKRKGPNTENEEESTETM